MLVIIYLLTGLPVAFVILTCLGISYPTLIVLSRAMADEDYDVKETVPDRNLFASNILIIYCH